MRVQDVMITRVLTIDASESVDRAKAKMLEAGVHQLVVRGKCRRIVGVIGAADVRGAPDGSLVEDFMPPKLFIVRPGTALGSAAALMRAKAIGSLPVLQGTRLVGIVTASDMLDVVDDVDGMLDVALGRVRRGREGRASARRGRKPRAKALN